MRPLFATLDPPTRGRSIASPGPLQAGVAFRAPDKAKQSCANLGLELEALALRSEPETLPDGCGARVSRF